jgi:hypothetical protein
VAAHVIADSEFQVALRREHVTLSKSRKSKELKLLELEARARDVQARTAASTAFLT